MKDRVIHIVFAGGGTGGHLFPGLVVAERLVAAAPHVRITFCGVGKPFEQEHVARHGFRYFALPARPLPRRARDAVPFVVNNVTSYVAATRFIREEHVAAVVGLGGYASVPMGRAAIGRGVPLVLLEQNAVAGRATRWLARRAAMVCASFDRTDGLNGRCPIRVTGNPVRRCKGRAVVGETATGQSEISSPQFLIANPTALRLLVLGGSGGAGSLNENVPRALYKIRPQLQGWQIIHQSGESGFDLARTLYNKLDLPATVEPFLDDVPETLSATDLAICRAGGTTLAELAAAGVPAVLLPYPRATDDHQAANARHFARGGGCVTIDELAAAGRLDERLAEVACFLLANDRLRRRMADAMCRLARPNAADDVAELVWSIASSRAVGAELSVA